MTQTAETRSHRSVPQREDAAFNWEDPLDLESELTEEERMVRDTARGYAQDKLFPRVLMDNREERFDRAIVSDMGALGLLGPTIPEEYGGAGLGYVAYGLITREIERVFPVERGVLALRHRGVPARLGGLGHRMLRAWAALAWAAPTRCPGGTDVRPASRPAAAENAQPFMPPFARGIQGACRLALPRRQRSANDVGHAPVAQLDRALPSEGRGHKFESCRARHRSMT